MRQKLTKKKKHAGGRPRKTLKDFNLPKDWKDIIYDMSAQGCSDIEIRAHFLMLGGKFCQKTWDVLKSRESEFLLTIQQAKILCQAWWERQGREGLTEPVFQTGCWYANMKNRFGWRDKQEIEHTADNDMKVLLSKYGSANIEDFQERVYSAIGRDCPIR